MCTQKPPYDYSEQLYNRYRDSFSLYITEKVTAPPITIENLHRTLLISGIKVTED
jgi:hypothetical protein